MRSLETKLNSLLGNELSEPLTTAVHASPKRPSAFGLFGVLWGFWHDRQARAHESLPGGLNVAIGLTDSALIVVDRSYWNTKVASVAADCSVSGDSWFPPAQEKASSSNRSAHGRSRMELSHVWMARVPRFTSGPAERKRLR